MRTNTDILGFIVFTTNADRHTTSIHTFPFSNRPVRGSLHNQSSMSESSGSDSESSGDICGIIEADGLSLEERPLQHQGVR